MIRAAVVIAWATLLMVLVGLAVGGCGAVDVVAAPDAAAETHTTADHPQSPAVEDASAAAPEAAAREAASCATWTQPPYCSSCRDARGVCMCGALPCCDQHCQS